MNVIEEDTQDWEEPHDALAWLGWQWWSFWGWLTEPMPFPRDHWYPADDEMHPEDY